MKGMRFFGLVIILSLICINFSNAQNTEQLAVDVYIAGSFMDGDVERAAFWKNSVRVELDRGVRATGIAVESGVVHVIGTYRNASNEIRVAEWVNGVRRSLPVVIGTGGAIAGWTFDANSIAVSGGRSYIVGFDNWTSSGVSAALWINGVKSNITGNVASDIHIENGITFISGYNVFRDGSGDRQQGWFLTSGQRVILDGGNRIERAHGITVKNGTVYVAGLSSPEGAVYWVDRARYILPDGRGFIANQIAVTDSGAIHVIGSSSGPRQYNYWINRQVTELAGATSLSAISTFNNNVYITGTFQQGAINVPAYWINGERHTIPGARTVNDIVVVRRTDTASAPAVDRQ